MAFIVMRNVLCSCIVTMFLRNSHAFSSEQFKITHFKKCSSTETMFRLLYGKSLSECVSECGIRSKCNAINYRKRRLQCELLETGNSTTFVPNSGQTGPCVYIHRRNMSLHASESCGNNCTIGEVCNTDSGTCFIQECHPLSLANGTTLGNMYNVGARIKTMCNEGFVEVGKNMYTMCNASGHWDPTIRCIEECSSTFQTAEGYFLRRFNNRIIANSSIAACKAACVAETSFICRSAEFYLPLSRCDLSVDTALTQPAAYFPNNRFIFYQRDCP